MQGARSFYIQLLSGIIVYLYFCNYILAYINFFKVRF